MKFPSTAAWIAGLTVCIAPVASYAQAPDSATPTAPAPTVMAQTPESVAARYAAAMQRRDWKAGAALMHPDALQQLKKMFRPLVFAVPNLELGKMFFNVRTMAEFDRLSNAQAFERLMTAVTKINPEIGAALATSKSQIIGHVLEGDDTAHVVYRMTSKVEGISVTKMAVMPLKKSGATWGGLLTGDIEGMAAALSRMTAPQTAPRPPAKKAPPPPAARSQRR